MYAIVQISEYDGACGIIGPFDSYHAADNAAKAQSRKEGDESCYSYEVMAMAPNFDD